MYRVLVAQYGEKAGRLAVGSQSGSFWWREVAKIRDGVGVNGGGWFEESIERRFGNGVYTFFWMDSWLGGVPLCVKCKRIFDLSNNKLNLVAVMC